MIFHSFIYFYLLLQEKNEEQKANIEINYKSKDRISQMGPNSFSVKIISINQKVDCKIKCKIDDRISQIEPDLYQKYPEFSVTENYFLCNGNKVDKSKTFKENKIKNNDTILLNQMNSSNGPNNFN